MKKVILGLSAFCLIAFTSCKENVAKKIEESNVAATAKNSNAMSGLAQLASDQPEKYAPLKAKADKVDQLSTEYYQYLQNIKEEEIPQIKKEFLNTNGIIIDIRNYPSTFVPFKLGSFFVSSLTPFVKFTKGNIDNPGEFLFTDNG